MNLDSVCQIVIDQLSIIDLSVESIMQPDPMVMTIHIIQVRFCGFFFDK